MSSATSRRTDSTILKQEVRLADGRSLLYFDDEPGKDRAAPDTRELPERSGGSEIRYDPVRDEWVAVASHRQTRTHLPPASECPLCPSRPGQASEIPASDYDVVVFENRFPSFSMQAFSMEGTPAAPASGKWSAHLSRAGLGRCEVICFSSDHSATFSTLPDARLDTIGNAWADRTRELSAQPGIEYVFCFENRGEEIGVTLHHSHGQIYAYPIVPPFVQKGLDSALRHRKQTGHCLFCDVLAAELEADARLVAETEHFVAFVPFAPRWPFEVHMYARRHVASLADLSREELHDAVTFQAELLARFDGIFACAMPYIAAWVQSPAKFARELSHLRLEIFSLRRAPNKLKFLAGSESAAGVFINDVSPESAAEMLRNAKGRG